MNLKEQGFRYLVCPDKRKSAWVHPLDLSAGHFQKYADWKDCTDMSHEEFEKYILGA
ncbi:hypothetical protein [Paraburkholderia phenoliruptrix]|uniref:hypothetical protein n=1 Tax=Paraburkholderia phenoliruptrix TaxID=252970 RepID=UPI0028604416|nr:hypothetical protein [Paraburkholderia phenoliruptrix]MDR6393488.1 hypothetical protein [Paraburkholderia phenoliruptrix]